MRRGRKVALAKDARADGVVDVVVHIRDAIRHGDDASLEGFGANGPCVAEYTIAHLGHKVQASPAVLDRLDHAKALLVVAEALRTDLIERAFARMAEGRVAEIVAERDRLGQILVQAERPCDRPRDLRDLERVGQPCAVVVALGRNEHLCLVPQPPERFRVEDAVAVALKAGAVRARLHRVQPPGGAVRKGRPRLEYLVFALFPALSDGHMYRLLTLGEIVT